MKEEVWLWWAGLCGHKEREEALLGACGDESVSGYEQEHMHEGQNQEKQQWDTDKVLATTRSARALKVKGKMPICI